MASSRSIFKFAACPSISLSKLIIVMDSVLDFVRGRPIIFAVVALCTIYGAKKVLDAMDEEDETNEEEASKKGPNKVAGIQNYGNTCFINSLIQALASLGSFQNNLKQLVSAKDHSPHMLFLSELLNAIGKINASQGVVEIDELLSCLQEVGRDLCNSQQQDSHEFYKVVTESLEVCHRHNLSRSLANSMEELSSLENSLAGYTRSCLQCSQCNNKMKIKVEVFYDLSLDISFGNIGSLERALQAYQLKEKLQGVNCIHCSIQQFLKKKIEVREKIQQLKLDPVLQESISSLIEFVGSLAVTDRQVEDINPIVNEYIDQQEQKLVPVFEKLAKNPTYQLLIEQFLSPVVYVKTTMYRRNEICKFPKVLVVHFKRLIIDPYTGMPCLLRKYIFFPQELGFKLKDGSQKTFKLTSVLSHSGNESMGHYYTFRKEGKDSDRWFYASDRNVERCSWNYVSRQYAYMMFYEN